MWPASGYLDGKLYLEYVLPRPASGRIGLRSKADSHVYFDDFTVTPANCDRWCSCRTSAVAQVPSHAWVWPLGRTSFTSTPPARRGGSAMVSPPSSCRRI